MVSFTQKSRSYLLLFVSLTQSIPSPLPLSFFTILTTSVLPAFALADLKTPKTTTSPVGDTNKSNIILAAAKTSITTPANLSSTSTEAVPHFGQTSPRDVLVTSPIAAANTLQLSKVSLSPHPVSCHPLSQIPLPLLKQILRLLPCPCKHLTLSLKSPLHKNLQSPLSKMSLYPGSSKKSPPQPTKPPKPQSPFTSASTSLPNGLPSSLRQTISNKLPSPRPHTRRLLFENLPFIVSWNIPDLVCKRYNISLDTSPFKGVSTPAKVMGQIFECFLQEI